MSSTQKINSLSILESFILKKFRKVTLGLYFHLTFILIFKFINFFH
jgi:hypothetical protein